MTKEEIKPPSLVNGQILTSDTWNDFVTRLRHDCEGNGVDEHHTADALFTVQAKRLIFGIDLDYTDKKAVCFDGSNWFSPQEYWDDCDEEGQAELNTKAELEHEKPFLELDESDQWEILAELDEHIVTGWDETWEYVNAHLTKDAAEAFIRRKKHDYRDGMRVFVESQYHACEFNTIKQGILSGQLVFNEEAQVMK